jgi:hypothetical protein
MFKPLFPAEEAMHPHHIGKWFVRTMDGGSILANDKSYTTVDILRAGDSIIYFNQEIYAVVAAWDYYNYHQENFPKDQQQRWHTLYGHNTSSIFTATCDDDDDDIKSREMKF